MKPKPAPEESKATPGPGALAGGALARQLSRRGCYRLLALCSPILLVLALEAGLRIAEYGYPASFFLTSTREGQPAWIQNFRFGWRFFPPSLARSPQPLSLPVNRKPGSVRVFLLGESAAMGDPEPSYGVARQLERLLQARHPSRVVEVVNVAMTAINSHVIREIASDCAKAQGDCWILYAGNNEVVGPFGAGTVFGAQAASLASVRLNLALKRSRVVQWINNMLPSHGQTTEWQGMEMFLQHEVGRDDPRLDRVYKNFGSNLAAIIDSGTRSGARVIVASVPVNLRSCPPFGSKHRAGLRTGQKQEWDEAFTEGREAERQSRFADALSAYEKAAVIDSEHAELAFRRAACQAALGLTNDAAVGFALARDLDTLRFRADSRLNEIARQTAQTKNVPFLPAAKECERISSAEGALREGFFYDHVHLNFAGNYWLACLLLPEVERQLYGEPASTHSAPRLEPDEMALRLAFTEYDRQRVLLEMRARLRQPPFSSQSNYSERDRSLEQQIQNLKGSPQAAIATYLSAIGMAPNDWVLHANFGQVLEAAGDETGAVAQWQEVKRLLPHEPDAYYQLGNLTQKPGSNAESEKFFNEALKRRPNSSEALNGLALVARARGQSAEAERQFESALRINPHYTPARVNLGLLLADTGRIAAAKEQYSIVLRMDTNNVGARINLAKLMMGEGNTAEATRLYREAVQLQPGNAIAHYNLGNLLCEQKQYPEAVLQYREAVKANPEFAEARYNLGLELARANRVVEALDHFAQAVRLRPEFTEAHFNYGVALAREKRYAEAVREFREAVRLDPQHPTAASLLERARMLAEQGVRGQK